MIDTFCVGYCLSFIDDVWVGTDITFTSQYIYIFFFLHKMPNPFTDGFSVGKHINYGLVQTWGPTVTCRFISDVWWDEHSGRLDL